jgi:long-chain acyl-CoA synthetase
MEVRRLFDFLDWQLQTNPRPDALAAKKNGRWRLYSSKEFSETVNRVSLGLDALGVRKGDKVGLISGNRPEWNFVDLGTLQIGAVVVPLYPTATSADYRYILDHAEVKILFVENEAYLRKVLSVRDQLPHLQQIYSFEPTSEARSWDEVPAAGAAASSEKLAELKAAVAPDDLATLVYTSGTTGNPKGVMLAHDNIVSNIEAVLKIKLFPEPAPGQRYKALSFLPLCHVFERAAAFGYIYRSVGIYYAEGLETIADNLKEVKPDMFTTVPRLLEKVYDKIMAKGADLKGLRKFLFDRSIALGLQYGLPPSRTLAYKIELAVLRKPVFSKWREALGGNVKLIISGGAALQPRLARLFHAAGIPVQQGYGMTETSPVISALEIAPGARLDSVGRVLPGVEIKIQPEPGYPPGEGEICVRGRLVMKGYYKNPQATAETIDPDGFLHTGDIGKMENGFLIVTDRKKEIFKTSGGKYIAPQAIENKFKESPFIEQMMVVGENQKFPAALVVPAFPALRDWCKKENVPFDLKHPRVKALYDNEIAKYNEQLAQFEKIKKYSLVPNEWTIDSNELTPTLKLKRRVLHEKYSAQIAEFYAE